MRIEGPPRQRTRIPRAALALAAVALAACSSGGSGDRTPSATRAPTGTSAAGGATATSVPAAAGAPVAGAYAARTVFPKLDFDQMLGLFPIPGDPSHALLLTKDGTIRRASLVDDAEEPSVFLDIRSRIIKNPGQEEGLLGLAFSPDYAASGKFYVYFSAGDPRRQVISRFVASGDHADASTEHVLLEIADPYPNHNGGAMAFGADGYLYLGEGDGGSAGDPNGNGQNTDALLGKILRIDVSGTDYAIPPDNPFAGGGGRGEVYAYGLRNPWRIAFDPVTNELWAGDVGQNKWEEIDRIVKGGNYGWNVMEGNHCYKPSSGCDTSGLIPPRAEYSHDEGCSVTGGYVYRGKAMRELQGWYLYSDYCSGRVWALNTADDASAPVELFNSKKPVTSFAQDADGELYLVTWANEVDQIVRRES